MQPSVRWDFQDYYLQRDTEYQVSPRLGLAYDINDSTLGRLSVGRFTSRRASRNCRRWMALLNFTRHSIPIR